MCDLKIAYFSHLSVLRKKKCENWYFRSISYPPIAFILSHWYRSIHTFLFFFFSLSSSLSCTPLLFFCKREWDKLVNLYANGFSLWTDRGVTVLSTARLCGGSRSDRGESPKISRSRTTAVYRPTKYDLYAIAVHWIAHRAISEYLIIHRLQASSHLVSRV